MCVLVKVAWSRWQQSPPLDLRWRCTQNSWTAQTSWPRILSSRSNVPSPPLYVKSSLLQIIIGRPHFCCAAQINICSSQMFLESVFFSWQLEITYNMLQRFPWMILDLQSKRIKIPSSGILFAGWWLFLLRSSGLGLWVPGHDSVSYHWPLVTDWSPIKCRVAFFHKLTTSKIRMSVTPEICNLLVACF